MNKENFWTDNLVEQFIKEQFFTRELKYLDAAIDDFKRDNKQEDKPKEKLPLFTTEDGVSLYDETDKVYSVCTKSQWETKDNLTVRHLMPRQYTGKPYSEAWLHFSSNEIREQYILLNKPVLSVNDIINKIRSRCDGTYSNDPEDWDLPTKASEIITPLTELAKSKIKTTSSNQ